MVQNLHQSHLNGRSEHLQYHQNSYYKAALEYLNSHGHSLLFY